MFLGPQKCSDIQNKFYLKICYYDFYILNLITLIESTQILTGGNMLSK